MIDREEFEAWKASNITQAVFGMLTAMSAEAKEAWMAASWQTGNVNPELLADLRARSQTAEDITNLTFEEVERHLEPSTS